MNKEFIPYKQALVLKELGFDEDCLGYFSEKDKYLFITKNTTNLPNGFIKAPLYQQAFRWCREKYNMLANVYSNASGFSYEYSDTIGGTHRFDSGYEGPNDSGCWDSYEEAELECLKKLIEVCKKH